MGVKWLPRELMALHPRKMPTRQRPQGSGCRGLLSLPPRVLGGGAPGGKVRGEQGEVWAVSSLQLALVFLSRASSVGVGMFSPSPAS